MEWFRWWHGTMNDPKFKAVARNAGTGLANVIAVWVSLLEHASEMRNMCDAPVTHGDITCFDSESCDINLGFDDGLTQCIIDQMEVKNLVKDGCIVNWSSRQPKREDSSAERTRAYRQRKKEASGLRCDADVTHCDARTEQNRTEHIREEVIDNSLIGFATDASQSCVEEIDEQRKTNQPESDLSLRSPRVSVETAVGEPVAANAQPTPPDTAIAGITSKAVKRPKTPDLCDESWLDNLSKTVAYQELNVPVLFGQMRVWCELHGKHPTKRRFISWLNRQDRPINVSKSNDNGGKGSLFKNAFVPRQPGESDEDYTLRKSYYEGKFGGKV